MSKPKVNVKPVADAYAGPGERIVEFSSDAGGGLISLALRDDGKLSVFVYNFDSTVEVSIGEPRIS